MVHLNHPVLIVMTIWSWSKTYNLSITCKNLDFPISNSVLFGSQGAIYNCLNTWEIFNSFVKSHSLQKLIRVLVQKYFLGVTSTV